jgi:di/tricarboxylate transporter
VAPVQVAVVAISILTIVLWCCSTMWADVIGNQGIVAMVPLIAFFGIGILDKDDFNSFLWHVVMLAQVGDHDILHMSMLLTRRCFPGARLPVYI